MAFFPEPPKVPVFRDPVTGPPVFSSLNSPDHPNVFPGARVLIVGAAPPAFVLQAAHRVGPEGHVFVVVRTREAVLRLKAHNERSGFTNLIYDAGASYPISVNQGSIDRAYLVSALHRIANKIHLLRAVKRALKADGLLGVDQRLLELGFSGRKQVEAWCREAGFHRVASYGWFWHYFLAFRLEHHEK